MILVVFYYDYDYDYDYEYPDNLWVVSIYETCYTWEYVVSMKWVD